MKSCENCREKAEDSDLLHNACGAGYSDSTNTKVSGMIKYKVLLAVGVIIVIVVFLAAVAGIAAAL